VEDRRFGGGVVPLHYRAQGSPGRSGKVFSATGARGGGPSSWAGHPSGTTASGRRWSGRVSSDRSSSPNTVVIVVSAEPSPRACAPSSRFCTAGQTDDSRTVSPQCEVSPHPPTRTGASATPPPPPAPPSPTTP